jgi:hypothetical protein
MYMMSLVSFYSMARQFSPSNHDHNATGLLDEDGRFDDGTFVEWTEQGHQINSQKTVDFLKAKGRRPLGKLLKWKHHEEVAERDGQDGRDLWCVVGQFIYNITRGLSPYYSLRTRTDQLHRFPLRIRGGKASCHWCVQH